MLIKQDSPFGNGYNAIAEMDGKQSDMLMDFGILKMQTDDVESNSDNKERAYLLIKGEVIFKWDQEERRACRSSIFSENPYVLHVPAQKSITIQCLAAETELCVQKVRNNRQFAALFYDQDMCRCEEFGKGSMQETSTRLVRTVFDADSAPYSNMVLGEVINYPGKWSSYPPHDHPQPEIYHYRFDKEAGFGFSAHEDEAYMIKNNYTMTISPHCVHSQVAAPGYAMYYIWLIPHLDNKRFGAQSRNFRPEHCWLLDPDAKIWPD